MVPTNLAVKESKTPETKKGQVVGVNGLANDFWDEIVGCRQANRREPKPQHIVTKPPIHGGLLDAKMQTWPVGDEKQDREPQ